MTIAPKAAFARWNMPIAKTAAPAVLYGNFAENGCIVKTAGVDDSILKFTGPAKVYESRGRSGRRHPRWQSGRRRRGGHSLRRTERRSGHAGDALPDHLPEIDGPRQSLRADHRWSFLWRHVRPLHWSRLPRKRQAEATSRSSKMAT